MPALEASGQKIFQPPRQHSYSKPVEDESTAVTALLIVVFAAVSAILLRNPFRLLMAHAIRLAIPLRLRRGIQRGFLHRFDNLPAEDYDNHDDHRHWITHRLCSQCRGVVNSSELFQKSWPEAGPSHETHPFYASFAELGLSASAMCHLCTILFYNVHVDDRRRLLAAEGTYELSVSTPSSPDSEGIATACLSGVAELQLRVSILSEYEKSIHIQLVRGTEHLGAPLAVTEGKNALTRPHTISLSTGSELVIRHIDRWTQYCRKRHRGCAGAKSGKAPSRLFYLGNQELDDSDEMQQPKVVSIDSGHCPPYVALSHCWGGADITQLTLTNYSAMARVVDIETLPNNFRDAIQICRSLKIWHLWIDSLCIVQDSPSDWLHESTRMGNIYSNAVFTIAADSSDGPQGGCFQYRNPLPYYPLDLTASSRSVARIALPDFTLESMMDTDVNLSPLNDRGWAFQERCLSTRVVHFGASGVLFECNSMYASDFNTDGRPYHIKNWQSPALQDAFTTAGTGGNRLAAMKDRRRRRVKLMADETIYSDARFGYRGSLQSLVDFKHLTAADELCTWRLLDHNRRWYDIVTIYSSRKLTRPSDRLIALSGVAQKIAEGSKLSYIQGLWMENLLYNLLWRRAGPVFDRPESHRAPSWSWGAIDSRVSHLFSVGSSISTGFGFKETRKFATEDLKLWKEVKGQAEVIDVYTTDDESSSRSVLEQDHLRLAMKAEVIEGYIDDIDSDYNAVFHASNGVSSRKCRLDFRLDEPMDRVWMVKICNHRAAKSVVHGLIVRLVPAESRGEIVTVERIGCFRIVCGNVLFRGAHLKRFDLI